MNPVRALLQLFDSEVRELRETVAIQAQTITAHKITAMAMRTQRDAANREVLALQEQLVSAQAGEAAAGADAELWRSRYQALLEHPSRGDG